MERLSNASLDGTHSLPSVPPPNSCSPSSAAGDYSRPGQGSGSSAVRWSSPPQLDSSFSSATAATSVPLPSPLHWPQHDEMPVSAADTCGPAALNPNYQAADKSLRSATVANSGAVVENERLKRAFSLNSGSAAPAGSIVTSLRSGSSTVVSGVGEAKSAAAAVVASSAQRLPLSPSRPLNCSGNNRRDRPINDVLNVSTARPEVVQAAERALPSSCLRDFRYRALQQKNSPTTPSAAASCASTTPSRAHGTLTAVRAPIELSRSWQKNTAQVASASQALLRLAPTFANVCQAVAVSTAGAPHALAAIARPSMPSAAVGSTVLRPPSTSLTVAVVNAAATTTHRRTSSAATAAVAAGPTASTSAAAATQEAARVAAANILRGVLDTGFAVTCLAHQAYRDALVGGTGRPANQLLDQQQLKRNGGCSNSGSRTTVVEVIPASTTVNATADSIVDKRLRLVWAVDENSRCVQRSALEVLASVLPQRHVCGYFSRFDNTRCKFRTESQLVLERHRRTAHVDAGGRLACARCGFTVRTPGHFHQHCSASHGDEGVLEAPTKTFCCPVCTYETAHPNRAQKHIERCVPAFDETDNLRPSEEALISTCVTSRDCRPTVADVLAEAQLSASLSQTASASGVVHREVVVTPRPYVGIASGQHQPSIVMRPPGGGISVSFAVNDGQQLLLQRHGLAGASQTLRTLAAAMPQPGLPGSVVAQGDINSMAVMAAAAAPQQPVVRLTARPAVLLPPGKSTAASATATAAAIAAALQQRTATTTLSQQSVARLVVLSGQQVASATGSQQQPAPSASQQLALRLPQLIAPAVARSTSHQVVAVGRLGEPQSSWPMQLQHAPQRGAVVPTTQAQLLPKKPVVTVTEALVAENAKRPRTVTMPVLRPTGRHQLSPPSISRPPALSSPTGRLSSLLATGGRPPAALPLTGRPTAALPRKSAAISSASRNLGQASAAQAHLVAADVKAKPGPSFSPDATISRQLVNCDICHNFLDMCDLPLHMARRHPDGLEHDVHIQCDQCSQRFAEVAPLVEHLLATHLRHDPVGPRPRHNSCFICLLPVSVETLLIHIAVNHSKIIFKMFNMRVCESPLCLRDRIVYANEQQLSLHVLEKHGMPTATLVPLVRAVNRMIRLAELDPRFWERCEQCNLTFRLRGEFLDHLQRDHLRYPCRLCSVGYLSAESLRWHMLRYHAIGARPQPCRVCRVPVASERLIAHCMAVHPQITRAHVRLVRIPYRQPASSEVVVATSTRAANEAPIDEVAKSSASDTVEAPGPTSSDVTVVASELVASVIIEVPESTSDVAAEIFESDMSFTVETPKPATSDVAIEARALTTSHIAVDVPKSTIFDVADGAVASAVWDPAVDSSASATSDGAIEVPTSVTSDLTLEAAKSATSGVAVEAALSRTSDLAVKVSASATSDAAIMVPASVTSDVAHEAAAPATSGVGVMAVASPMSDLAVETSAVATSSFVIEASAFATLDVALEAAASSTSVAAVEAAASTSSDLVVETSTSDVAIEAPAFATSAAVPVQAAVAVGAASSDISGVVDVPKAVLSDIVDVPKAVMSDIDEGTKPAMCAKAAETPMGATLAVVDKDLQHAIREELDEDIEPPAKKTKF